MLMNLWTFQSEETWQELQSEEVLRIGPFNGDRLLDNWMAEQLSMRVGSPPEGAAYPVWGWYQQGARRRPEPDTPGPNFYTYADRFVRLEVNIPDCAVLLSSFHLWENIEFGWILTRNAQEMKSLVEEINGAGFSYHCSDAWCAAHHDTGKLGRTDAVTYLALCEHNSAATKHPELGPLIRQRWEFIFDPEYVSGKFAPQGIYDWTQAVFWELRLEHVVGATHFRKYGGYIYVPCGASY